MVIYKVFVAAMSGTIVLTSTAACSMEESNYSVISQKCDVSSLDHVFSQPSYWVGKRFCGNTTAIKEGRVIKVFPYNNVPDDRNDIVLILDEETQSQIEMQTRNTDTFHLYLEGFIGGSMNCLEDGKSSDITCTPYRRPLNLKVTKYRLKV